MKTKKAFIKTDGKIGEREQPAIEYIDKDYTDKMNERKKKFDKLLADMKDGAAEKPE
jgi:hypothetical protein